MEKEIINTITNLDTQYLCELYQHANNEYFTAYISDDEQGKNYYQELIFAIGQELRDRDYWRY